MHRYKVEPYVVAADVYSVAPHVGRGGWTWYTGSAGWMYRAGIEGILGLQRRGNVLTIEPSIDAAWSGFTAIVKLEAATCQIRVRMANQETGEQPHCLFDNESTTASDGLFQIPIDGRNHELLMVINADARFQRTL